MVLLSRGFQCQCLPATPLQPLLPTPCPCFHHASSHLIVFAPWLPSKFISMTLRRRRHWSSSSASQLPGSLEGGCDTPFPAHARWQYKFVCDADSIIDLGFDLTRTTTTATAKATMTMTMTLSKHFQRSRPAEIVLKVCDLPRPYPQ